MSEKLSFDEFKKKYQYKRSDEIIAYELYLIIKNLKEENDILKQKLRKNYIVNKQYEEMKRLQEENEQLKKKNEELQFSLRAEQALTKIQSIK